MIIGLDIGGTGLKAGVVKNGKIIRKLAAPTGASKKEIIGNILGLIAALDSRAVSGIGIGAPGPADYEKGVIGSAPNIPLAGVNLKKLVGRRFGKPVLIDNDANCYVLGEARRLKKKNVAGLTLGTGVGGGVVIDGRLYRGTGNAGELGHCSIDYNGAPCKCGSRGCIECYASATGVRKLFGKAPTELSKKEWKEYGKWLGVGVANIINAFAPEAVVLGGGLSKSFRLFKAALLAECSKRVFAKDALKAAKIIRGASDSGILGAAGLFDEPAR